MKNGKLSKTEIKALHRAWDIVDSLSDYKGENGEYDDAYTYANRVSDAIMWLLGEVCDEQ